MADKQVALVVGVTGIVGLSLAKRLLNENWRVYGISRRKQEYLPASIEHIALDLTNAESCKTKLAAMREIENLRIFFAAWVNMGNEPENCVTNRKLLENLIDNISSPILHLVLVHGTKHYLGSFDKYVPEEWIVPFKETSPKLSYPNYYYDQLDTLFDRAAKRGFTWSVARPHVVIGFAPYNNVNAGTSIAVYATLCKYLKRPFIFPGDQVAYDTFRDVTDADLLAEHLIWEATEPRCQNEAFNIVNGDVFRWRYLWQAMANYFDLELHEPPQEPIDMENAMKDMGPVWDEIVARYDLQKLKITDLTTWWALNKDLDRDTSCFSDMSKSREMGFLRYKNTEKAYLKLFDYLRHNKYIP